MGQHSPKGVYHVSIATHVENDWIERNVVRCPVAYNHQHRPRALLTLSMPLPVKPCETMDAQLWLLKWPFIPCYWFSCTELRQSHMTSLVCLTF